MKRSAILMLTIMCLITFTAKSEARWYSAELGRFLSEDPLGVEAGLNFYAYVNGNPVNYTDPYGLAVVPMGISRSEFDDAFSWLPSWLSNLLWDVYSEPAPTAGMCSVRQFTPSQSALIDLAKAAKRRGVSLDEASILKDWAKELNLPFRGPEQHLNRNFQDIHIHIGPVNKIPVRQ